MKLTGRKAKDVTVESDRAKLVFKAYGIEAVSPWDKEKYLYESDDTIGATQGVLCPIWADDKTMIRSCQGVCDITGNLFSRGASLETGMNRYGLMRPTVWVDTANSVRNLDGDLVVKTVEEAALLISQRWGTWLKRVTWRLKTIWNPRSVWIRIKEELRSWL